MVMIRGMAVDSSRQRHPGHFADDHVDAFDRIMSSAGPLRVGRVIEVATNQTVDLKRVAARIQDATHLYQPLWT
jgi:hypothetical protein